MHLASIPWQLPPGQIRCKKTLHIGCTLNEECRQATLLDPIHAVQDG